MIVLLVRVFLCLNKALWIFLMQKLKGSHLLKVTQSSVTDLDTSLRYTVFSAFFRWGSICFHSLLACSTVAERYSVTWVQYSMKPETFKQSEETVPKIWEEPGALKPYIPSPFDIGSIYFGKLSAAWNSIKAFKCILFLFNYYTTVCSSWYTAYDSEVIKRQKWLWYIPNVSVRVNFCRRNERHWVKHWDNSCRNQLCILLEYLMTWFLTIHLEKYPNKEVFQSRANCPFSNRTGAEPGLGEYPSDLSHKDPPVNR